MCVDSWKIVEKQIELRDKNYNALVEKKLDGINSRLDIVEEKIEHEDIVIKIIENQTVQKVNRALVGCGDNFKQPNVSVIEVPDGNLDLYKAVTKWVNIKL